METPISLVFCRFLEIYLQNGGTLEEFQGADPADLYGAMLRVGKYKTVSSDISSGQLAAQLGDLTALPTAVNYQEASKVTHRYLKPHEMLTHLKQAHLRPATLAETLLFGALQNTPFSGTMISATNLRLEMCVLSSGKKLLFSAKSSIVVEPTSNVLAVPVDSVPPELRPDLKSLAGRLLFAEQRSQTQIP